MGTRIIREAGLTNARKWDSRSTVRHSSESELQRNEPREGIFVPLMRLILRGFSRFGVNALS